VILAAWQKSLVKEALEDFTKKIKFRISATGHYFLPFDCQSFRQQKCVYSQNCISRKVDQVIVPSLFTILWDSGRSEEVMQQQFAGWRSRWNLITCVEEAGSHEMSQLFSMRFIGTEKRKLSIILPRHKTTDANCRINFSYAMERSQVTEYYLVRCK